MKKDSKSFQERYEAWKNGADYWKDIRGINLGGDAQEELSDDDKKKLDDLTTNVLAEYTHGKGNFYSLLSKLQRLVSDYVYNELIKAGVDPIVASGINGNIAQESAFNPNASNGTHWGLVQNSAQIRDYVRKAYGGYGLKQLVQWLADMANGTPRKIKHAAYNDMVNRSNNFRKNTYTTPLAAAHGWEKYYELSGGLANKNRMNYAGLAYQTYYTPPKNNIQTAALINELNIADSPYLLHIEVLSSEYKTPYVPQDNLVMKNYAALSFLEPVVPEVVKDILQGNNFGKDAYGLKFWQRRGNNLHFNFGKNLPKYNTADKSTNSDESTDPYENEGFLELIAKDSVPIYGTIRDYNRFRANPSIGNGVMLALSAAGEIPFAGAVFKGIKAGALAVKAAKAARVAEKAVATATRKGVARRSRNALMKTARDYNMNAAIASKNTWNAAKKNFYEGMGLNAAQEVIKYKYPQYFNYGKS